MTTIAIRKKLIGYLNVADAKKIKAMYALLADEIEQEEFEYDVELKNKLDEGQRHYKNGGKMITAATAEKQINKILQSGPAR
jgi:hypothetical protein